jgi:tellurite resistance protein
VVTLQNFYKWFDCEQATREQFRTFLIRLGNAGIAIEPDVLGGARMPKLEDRVCLYEAPAGEANTSSAQYLSALVVIEVSSAIAHADKVVTSDEEEHLMRQVETWPDLNAIERAKLAARARLLLAAPVSLASLRLRIEPLDAASKEAVAVACASMVTADGHVDPAEVRILERVYTALGLDKTRAYAAVQAAVSIDSAAGDSKAALPARDGANASAAAGPATPAVKLNLARIKALKEETREVTAILGAIFTEQEPEAPTPAALPAPELLDDGLLLALDAAHSAFARIILSRVQWSRAELAEVAAERKILLEGALERINDAAFDQHEMPLVEGDDPIEVNNDILELLPQ